MENIKLLKVVNKLYKNAKSWDIQTKVIKHNSIADLLKSEKLIIFKEFGSAVKKTNRKFTYQSDFYPTVKVEYYKKDFLEYIIKNGIIRWGDLEIRPNGMVIFKGVIANKLFLKNNKSRKMLAYLILLEYATIDELYKLLKIEDTPLPDDYIKAEEKIINEFYCKYRAYRIKILRSQAIRNLIKIFDSKDGNVIKEYAQRMFYFKDTGYGIVDFECIESMVYTTSL